MKCPICKTKLLVEVDVFSGIVHEEVQTCTCCRKYHYEFAYGTSFTRIGNTEVMHHYKDSKTKTARQDFIMKNRITKERKRWKRKHSKKGGK